MLTNFCYAVGFLIGVSGLVTLFITVLGLNKEQEQP